MANNKIDSLKVGETLFDITLPADAGITISTISVTGSATFSDIKSSWVDAKSITITSSSIQRAAIIGIGDGNIAFGDASYPAYIWGSGTHPIYCPEGNRTLAASIALTSDLGTQVTYTYSAGILDINTK